MPTPPSRRSFFARLFGAAAAGAAASAAGQAADPAAPRCPHYHDGGFWRPPHGPPGTYVSGPDGCPFCRGLPATPAAGADPLPRVTIYTYEDGRPLTIAWEPPRRGTTTTYDVQGRVVSVTPAHPAAPPPAGGPPRTDNADGPGT